jgi:aminoglycoside phosphotransferase (APT) family kinase protein
VSYSNAATWISVRRAVFRSTRSRIPDGIGTVTGPLHEDEFPIDVGLVRALVDRALPECAALPLSPLRSGGSSNALFRLGRELLVRLPRQPGGSATMEKEARWLPLIGPRLPASVPEIVALGDPGLGYPERWSVVRWIEGSVPTVVDPRSDLDVSRRPLALDLAAVINALRDIDVPPSALTDPELRWYRGDPLGTQDDRTRQAVEDCRTITNLDLDLDMASRVWDEAMTLPGIAQASTPRWFHGDLLAENLLVSEGRLAAVLDFGGLAVGDPTVDLIVAWEVLDDASRQVFRHATGVDEQSWLAGRAWALALALMTFPYYWRTMPDRCASRVAIVRSVLADAATT